jgi:oxazoline/thiazoline synthase
MHNTRLIQSITLVGELPQADLHALLEMAKIFPQEAGRFHLVLTSDYLHPDLEAINAQHLAASTPWMIVRPLGNILWVGPLFIPVQSGCWACMAEGLRQNKQVSTPEPFDARSAALALEMALNEFSKPVPGQLITFDLATSQTEAHQLVRLPHCPACGTITTEQAQPIVLAGGQPIPAEVTFQKYQHHISPLLGIVHSLERVEVPHEAMSVYSVTHNPIVPGQSFGKGSTEAQAKVSGLCEALERYSSRFQGHEPRIQARYQDLQAQAIHPYQILGYSQAQYQNRDQWNGSFPGIFIPEPFDEAQVIDWSPVWSLSTQAVRYVPTALAYLSYPGKPPWAAANSNGNAAGGTLEEAIFQGMLELVERDAVAIWWYNRLTRPAVHIDSPAMNALQAVYEQQGLKLWLLDLTTDLDIPVFVAGCSTSLLSLGFGCHLDPDIAAQRAVAELSQALSRESHILRQVGNFPLLREHPQIKAAPPADYLVPDPAQPPKTLADYRAFNATTFEEFITAGRERIEACDLSMLVLNLTRPEIGLPVARTIIPGLCHWNVNFGHQRLVDVPVKMGWRTAPATEDSLTQVPPLA